MRYQPETSVLRALAVDAVENARSGHPGMPMGMAEIAEVLWRRNLRHDPAAPDWPDRDRFVLSNGHGSMLLYSLLHLTGYDLPLEELQRFRQLGSKTPGHPERGLTPGVETTTGPLGQGLANAVGMALAERLLALEFNRPGHSIVDHRTFVFVGDGCLMEGISHEACSLAGTLGGTVGLGKLVVFYDDNGISIDGAVEGWFTDDTPARFEAYGWQVITDVDGHDSQAVEVALKQALADDERPSLICCRTVIGMGSPGKGGSHDVHGAPLGPDEVAEVRATIGWPYGPFEVPEPVREAWDARAQGERLHSDWAARFERYRSAYPEQAAEFERRTAGELPVDWHDRVSSTLEETRTFQSPPTATRRASQLALEQLAPALPELFGGSADLTGSNLTNWSGSSALSAAGGNYLSYGVREFGMTALMNGLALHGGLIPYGGTFLMFSEYARNAIRMAALMQLRSIFVFTHDSIGVGEDGPTHQPVEQTATLRLMPGLDVWRPCDQAETVQAWARAIERQDGPTALILSRQNLPEHSRTADQAADISRGGYVLREVSEPAAVIVGTGSEVALAMAAAQTLSLDDIPVRVVSMPCVELFDRQPAEYRDQVLPPGIPRVVVEAGATRGWYYHSAGGPVIGIDSFGESGPAADLFEHFSLTVDAVASAVRGVAGPGH
ncbi:transketolase [Marmoricola sp. URHA0025 HA25]